MGLAFTCPGCGTQIVVKYLKIGEPAACRNCGKKVTVPGDASQSDDVPLPPGFFPTAIDTTEATPAKEQNEHESCPSCAAEIVGNVNTCSCCGLSLRETSLYNPRYFPHLAFFLSAMVPIYMAASNWGRLGQPSKRRHWLFLGGIGFALLCGVVVWLDRGSSIARLVGLLNFPIGLYLRSVQRPLYAAGLKLGAKRASIFKGSLLGLGLFFLAFGIAAVPFFVHSTKLALEAADLMDQGNYKEAVASLEELLRWDPDDVDALHDAALCYMQISRWNEASGKLELYVRQRKDDPWGYALLGYVRERQGRHDDAKRHYANAKELDPRFDPRLLAEIFRGQGEDEAL